MNVAIISKDKEYAEMLEYELCFRGYCAFCSDSYGNADVAVMDLDTYNFETVTGDFPTVTFSYSEESMLKRPFAISDLVVMISEVAVSGLNRADGTDIRRAERIYIDIKSAKLSGLETKVLSMLFDAEGGTVTVDELLKVFKSQTENGLDRIRVCINSIRRKLKSTGGIDPIVNVRGKGYCINTEKYRK